MQDRYIGDIGDFGKYALLNFIQRETKLKLGVNWYRTAPDDLKETHSNDGKITKYDNLKHLDICLYCKLQKIIADDARKVKEVEKRGILPEGTVFFSDKFDVVKRYVVNREKWFKNAMAKFERDGEEIVFLDPDNGVSNNPYSAKHVLFSEIQAHINKGRGVIVYNHCNRKPGPVYRDYFKPLREISFQLMLPAIRFHRKIPRDYIFVLHSMHHQLVTEAIHAFLKTPWGQKEKGFKTRHFERTPDWFYW